MPTKITHSRIEIEDRAGEVAAAIRYLVDGHARGKVVISVSGWNSSLLAAYPVGQARPGASPTNRVNGSRSTTKERV